MSVFDNFSRKDFPLSRRYLELHVSLSWGPVSSALIVGLTMSKMFTNDRRFPVKCSKRATRKDRVAEPCSYVFLSPLIKLCQPCKTFSDKLLCSKQRGGAAYN